MKLYTTICSIAVITSGAAVDVADG
jgi:hypothetical protein